MCAYMQYIEISLCDRKIKMPKYRRFLAPQKNILCILHKVPGSSKNGLHKRVYLNILKNRNGKKSPYIGVFLSGVYILCNHRGNNAP